MLKFINKNFKIESGDILVYKIKKTRVIHRISLILKITKYKQVQSFIIYSKNLEHYDKYRIYDYDSLYHKIFHPHVNHLTKVFLYKKNIYEK